jgi:hypothetical protein
MTKIGTLYPVLIAVLALGLATTVGTPARAKSCDDRTVSAPTIRINVEFHKPVLLTNLSRERLRRHRGGPAHPMGLTEVAYNHRMEMGVKFLPVTGGQGGCYEPAVIKVDIVTSPVKVYLASELKSSSCAYRVTLAHENRHVKNAREAVQRNTHQLRDTIQAALPKRMQPARSANDAVRKLQAILKPIVEEVMREVTSEAHARDVVMDTPDAYAAETAKCGDWPR